MTLLINYITANNMSYYHSLLTQYILLPIAYPRLICEEVLEFNISKYEPEWNCLNENKLNNNRNQRLLLFPPH